MALLWVEPGPFLLVYLSAHTIRLLNTSGISSRTPVIKAIKLVWLDRLYLIDMVLVSVHAPLSTSLRLCLKIAKYSPFNPCYTPFFYSSDKI